ncbi:MAG TPA: hypothetical protein VKZ44_02300 [Taishania sp.]|nr:hypothetical protein [Taishania sp.]
MKHTIFTALAVILSSAAIYSQNKTPWTEEGVRQIAQSDNEAIIVNNCSLLTQEGYFYFAEILVDRLLEFQPTSSNYNYRKGFLAIEIRKDVQEAIPRFEIAVKNVNPNYDMYSPKEKSAPADAFYHMGRCYHLNEQLDLAKINYESFLQLTRKNSELIEETKMRLKQVELARELIKNPVNCTLKNIEGGVNTQYPDYSSIVSFDGSALYFTSRRPWENNKSEKLRNPKDYTYMEDVYVSYLGDDDVWSTPVRLDFCKPDRNEATIALSTDEKRLYLYEDITGNGDIYYSDFSKNEFNEIVRLENNKINTVYWETHIMTSHDGSLLVFSSERPGGYGGRDLYICKKMNGQWSEPENLGPHINGPYDEDAPFFSVDNKQLYFATNDERSIGGFDILISEIQKDGSWGKPKNIGYPFNSCNDDLFYTTTVDGLRGYLTSYRSNGKGEKDIYEIHNDFLGVKSISVLKGEVLTTTGELLPDEMIFQAKITCHDCESSPVNHIIYTRKRDGKFMTGLKPCKEYTITYIDDKDGKVMGEESFKTECNQEYHEIFKYLKIDVKNRVVVFPKEELANVEVVDYKNLELKYYFDYNKNKINVKKGDLRDFAKEIKDQLKNGRQKVTITIESSASTVPTKTFSSNEELAKLRAENMKYDLLEFFEKGKESTGKVTIVITQTIVQGPPYEQDFKNSEKYRPYQYVFLKTE